MMEDNHQFAPMLEVLLVSGCQPSVLPQDLLYSEVVESHALRPAGASPTQNSDRLKCKCRLVRKASNLVAQNRCPNMYQWFDFRIISTQVWLKCLRRHWNRMVRSQSMNVSRILLVGRSTILRCAVLIVSGDLVPGPGWGG